MPKQTVNLELMQFVELNILPRYTEFDRAHNLSHVTSVIRRSLDIAERLGADLNMAYCIAAYHDLGLEGPRAIHHITGGKILAADARLKKWFSASEIRIMQEAVEDHRASASHEPRSLYGKIVAEADRDLSPETVFSRIVAFGLDNYPELPREQHWERFREHVQNKYSSEGYIRLWLPNSPNADGLKQIRAINQDKKLLREQFDKYFNEQTAAKNA